MQITSSAFKHEGSIPSKYTCDGKNTNPPIEFLDVPEAAKALVLIVNDPDVPMDVRADGLWVHWVVFNIDPTCLGVGEGEKFESGIEGTTTYNKPGYGGPCPPDREHRYFFKLYALDALLNLDASATKGSIERAMHGHILEEVRLMGKYYRT